MCIFCTLLFDWIRVIYDLDKLNHQKTCKLTYVMSVTTIAEPPTLKEDDVVTILGNYRFTGMQGLIIDMNSNKQPEDGPVAVFFDHEIRDHEFGIMTQDERWTGPRPTKENQHKCKRVVCFQPQELRKEEGFPLETMVIRKFGSSPHHLHEWSFPLKPGTHACQLKACESNLLATKLTLINVWGTIQAIYTCEKCHEGWDGVRTDGVTFKDPLPGAPSK